MPTPTHWGLLEEGGKTGASCILDIIDARGRFECYMQISCLQTTTNLHITLKPASSIENISEERQNVWK